MKPYLKWAGGKYRIVERLKTVLPAGKRLIEPFIGSGAVFLNTNYPNYLLADLNQDLIRHYQFLQREGTEFIAYCQTFFTSLNNFPEAFYELRREFNVTQDLRLKAALFLYLNRHCYNGLCRYNAKGGFNTPFGRYAKPYFPEKEMLFFYHKMTGVEFKHADFVVVMESAEQGDVVYCDPPYVPLSKTANFTNFSSDGFSETQQQQLANMAEKLADRGITVIISNHNTEFTQQIYHKAKMQTFDVRRFISSKVSQRENAAEVLAVFG